MIEIGGIDELKSKSSKTARFAYVQYFKQCQRRYTLSSTSASYTHVIQIVIVQPRAIICPLPLTSLSDSEGLPIERTRYSNTVNTVVIIITIIDSV